MIGPVNDLAPFEEGLAASPCLGAQMWADWQLRAKLFAFFYQSDTGGLVQLDGRNAFVHGRFDPEELALFLGSQGVEILSSGGCVPAGWRAAPRAPLVWAGESVERAKQAAPSIRDMLDLLNEDGRWSPAALDWTYRKLCQRRNHGLCEVVGVYENHRLASVAALWAKAPWEGYIAGVHTRRGARGKGYATLLVRALCAQNPGLPLRLLCTPRLEGFYQKLGFAKEEGSRVLECTPAGTQV